MNKKRLFFVLILMTGVLVGGCVKKEPIAVPEAPEVGILKPITKSGTVAFTGGEKLTFAVKALRIIPIGTVSIEVREMVYQGHEVYAPLVKFKANRLFSFFCPAEGVIKSYFDAQRLYTHRFEEHSVMGRHIYDRHTNYNQKDRLAQFTYPNYDKEGRLVKTEIKKVRTLPNTQDILSSLYYIRALEFKEGKVLSLNVNERRSNYRVELKVLEKEKVKTPAGLFLAWKVEPISIHKGDELQEKGKGIIYFTADKRNLPVKMMVRTNVGSVTLVLIDVKL
ncbi:DUF3108 domain-containing protein [bacterium]|nr:DUF3108 domain-containing protein [bacterium]